MKALFVISALLACSVASAQFVAGNEAVHITTNGPQVDQPPTPTKPPPLCGANARCHAGAWRMVETSSGLMECTEPWAREGSCRTSTYGAQKLRRVWVVRRDGEWLQCQYPDLGSRCAPMRARPPANLPADALQ